LADCGGEKGEKGEEEENADCRGRGEKRKKGAFKFSKLFIQGGRKTNRNKKVEKGERESPTQLIHSSDSEGKN